MLSFVAQSTTVRRSPRQCVGVSCTTNDIWQRDQDIQHWQLSRSGRRHLSTFVEVRTFTCSTFLHTRNSFTHRHGHDKKRLGLFTDSEASYYTSFLRRQCMKAHDLLYSGGASGGSSWEHLPVHSPGLQVQLLHRQQAGLNK